MKRLGSLFGQTDKQQTLSGIIIGRFLAHYPISLITDQYKTEVLDYIPKAGDVHIYIENVLRAYINGLENM